MNRIDLEGRRAVVTGGARGIGLATAERMLESGASVVLWDVDGAAIEAAVAKLGEKASGSVVELTDEASVDKAAKEALAGGAIDILVNNAGITGGNGKTWELEPGDLAKDHRGQSRRPLSHRPGARSGHGRRRLRPHRQCRLDRRQGGQSQCLALFGVEGGPDRPHQVARQGAGRRRRPRQLHHPGRRPHGDLRPDEPGAHRLHAVEDPAGPLRRASRSRRADRLARRRRTAPSPPAPCSTFPAAALCIEPKRLPLTTPKGHHETRSLRPARPGKARHDRCRWQDP